MAHALEACSGVTFGTGTVRSLLAKTHKMKNPRGVQLDMDEVDGRDRKVTLQQGVPWAYAEKPADFPTTQIRFVANCGSFFAFLKFM